MPLGPSGSFLYGDSDGTLVLGNETTAGDPTLTFAQIGGSEQLEYGSYALKTRPPPEIDQRP